MNNTLNWLARNALRIVAAAALVALSGVMAAYNAGGFVARGLPLLAALAIITEALAFVMAVQVEAAARSRCYLKALACFAILAGSEAYNAAGSHMAWDADQAPRLRAEQEHAQAALDQRRASLQMEIARVPLPDPSAISRRQAEARATWEAATATARRQLDALPLVAEVAPPFPAVVVWTFLGFLGFAKALGLWAVGMSVGAIRHAERAEMDNPGRVLVMRRWAKRAA
jgi:hypothetical protein